MLSYDLEQRGNQSRYEYLARRIRDDIAAGRIAAGERLPSKRALADHLGVGLVTVENAYAQLVAEGFVRAEERRGYFAQELPRVWKPDAHVAAPPASAAPSAAARKREPPLVADLSRPGSGEAAAVGTFWTRALRSCMAHESYADLFGPQPFWGNERLRTAIAAYLRGARGMDVAPEHIFVGAGAQVLYGIVVQLLGADRTFAVENPGYLRLADIYAAYGASVAFAQVDKAGMSVASLRESGGDVAHVTPSHQFPTGHPMPVTRRYELLSWAYEQPQRVIVEDDYDWEFRFSGKPTPPLAAIDADGRVLYLSTFSKSLSSALRIAYLVVPERLAKTVEAEVGFFSNTVSAIDQVTLARTLESGAYERHLARYRNQQRKLRDALVEALVAQLDGALKVHEADSGLHFVLEVVTDRSEEDIVARARAQGVKLAPLSSYCHGAYTRATDAGARFVVQYSGVAPERVDEVARVIAQAARGGGGATMHTAGNRSKGER